MASRPDGLSDARLRRDRVTTEATTSEPIPDPTGTPAPDATEVGPLSVFRNPGFLRLWLSQAATLTGVPVRGIKVAVYMLSALSAGIAGIVMTGWLGAVTTNIGTGMELQVIAAAVIGGANLAGGVGTAFGALVGSALIEIIRNSLGLLGINAFWQGTFIGSFIIVAVAFDRLRRNR